MREMRPDEEIAVTAWECLNPEERRHVLTKGDSHWLKILNTLDQQTRMAQLYKHIAALKTYIRWLEDEDWPQGLWEENRIRHGLRADLGLPEDDDPPGS